MTKRLLNSKLVQYLRPWPRWFLALGAVGVVAGAATGTVLSGQVDALVPVTVSQSLLVETVQITGGDAAQGFRSDDGTKFSAAVELTAGDPFEVHLALVNQSDEDLVGELSLDFPDGMMVSVIGSDGVSQVVQTGLTSWLFTLEADHANMFDDMVITVALTDNIAPGFVRIEGNLRQVDLQPPVADLSIAKSASPSPATVGSDLTYTITASNGGPDAAAGVVVTDTIPSGVLFVSASASQGSCSGSATVTCDLGSLQSGDSATVSIVVIPTSEGTIANTADVGGNSIDPDGVNDSDTINTTVNAAVVPLADLSIAKSDSPDPVLAGSTLIYTLDVNNVGPDRATSVVVTDTLPAGVTFVSTTGAGWTCTEASLVVTCTRASPAVGAAPPITITVTAPASSGTMANSASVSSATTDLNPANNSASESTTVDTAVATGVDLSISKGDSPDPVLVGSTLTYILSVSNAGPDTATSIVATDDLPAGVTFVSATGAGWSCSLVGTTVTCTRASLAVGTAAPIAIKVTAPANTGIIINSASVSSATADLNSANNSSSESTTVIPTAIPVADLSVTKSDSPDPVLVGSTLTYILSVSNAGPDTATSIVATDDLPAGVTFVSATGSGWSCTEASLVVTCTTASLAVGTAPPITITTTAPASGGTIVNSASVSSAATDLNDTNDADSESTTVHQPVTLWVVDEGANQVFKYGEAGTLLGTFNLTSANLASKGITTDGNSIWIVDKTAKRVYRYNLAGGFLSSFDITTPDTHLEGITTDGTRMWILDIGGPKNVFQYDMSGIYQGLSFSLDAANSHAEGITSDGSSLWVVDKDADKVFEYSYAGTLLSSFSVAPATHPEGITTDGSDIWIVGKDRDKVYKFSSTGTSLGSFAVHSGNLKAGGMTRTPFTITPP